jgi:endonuclease/exonuclease/phosphatase family metal-dependent hydrolase
VPLVGAYFRDTLWLLHALPCLLLLIALIIDKKQTVSLEQSSLSIKKSSLLIVLSVFALGIFSIVYMTSAKPQVNEQTKPLKIVTFNMQQGRDINGFKAHDKQLELIKSLNPDIIGLQESGPLRVSGGNVDVVRYLADKLNYYSYYGASPITGTYGIALLSRFPIEQPKTHFLSSDYEQIATIVAKIKIRGVYYTVSVNHPAGNNYFKMKQVKETLSFLETENPVICMGDFNFVEGSDCYKEMTNSFKDSWNQGKKDIVPKERCSTIDHIFVSKHINVLNSHCIKTTYSDHNLVYTEIQTVEYL